VAYGFVAHNSLGSTTPKKYFEKVMGIDIFHIFATPKNKIILKINQN